MFEKCIVEKDISYNRVSIFGGSNEIFGEAKPISPPLPISVYGPEKWMLRQDCKLIIVI